MVVDALKEHTSLLEKYDALFKDNDHYYYDQSLHLLAFDLMYCCRCYNFYGDMKYKKKKESIKAYSAQKVQEKEAQERQAKLDELDRQIHEIEVQMDLYQEISLLGVEVSQARYGTGIVVSQEGSKITVEFSGHEKPVGYIINKKYAMRPRFEADEEIVDAFTKYDELVQKKNLLEKEKSRI